MKKIIILIVLILVVISTHSKPSHSSYFDIAEQRIEKYNPKRKDLVIIVDYRKNIFSERIFVLDMKKKEIILSENVSHAWNSGFLFPKSYSNTPGTYKSSKGTFITRGTRYGSYGYSMIIDGLDHGVNNNTKFRYILFHSNAKTKTIWSAGCFSTSEHINKKIIDLTKGGVLVCVID